MKKLLGFFSALLVTAYVFAQPANNNCSTSSPLLSLGSTTTGTVANATLDGALTNCTGTELYDVWYRFVAKTANPTIYLTNLGANFTSPGLQISTAPGSGSLFCGTTSISATGLVANTTYYLRVFSTGVSIPTTAAGFDITVVDSPANDACSASAPLLTSGVTTTGTVANATLDGTINTCPNTELYDVWYRFVAQSSNPLISLTNQGANFTSPGLQLSAGCATASLFCGTTSINATGLSIGTTYYLRVFSTAAAIPITNAGFSITVIDPPANDACSASAPLLTSGVTTTGTVAKATLDGTINTCTGTELYDVWYRFTAQSANPVIYLTNQGANFVTPGLQVSAGCGTASLACGTTSVSPIGLSIGTTYYLRVFSTAVSIPTTNAGFSITVVDPPVNDFATSAIVLTPTASCEENVSMKSNQSIAFATYTSGVGSSSTCTDQNARDVWYKFVANDTTHNIILNNLGSGWSGSQRIQLLTNSAADGSGTWTHVACANASTLTATTTVGTTYFIRVHRNNTGNATGATWGFSICVNKAVVSGSRMKEIFSRTVLSGPNQMQNPWEVIYGLDNNLWVTDSKNYRVYKINPVSGAKTMVLDIGNAGTHPMKCQYNNVTVNFQGGLAGMALHPNFLDGTVNETNWAYLSYGYSQTSSTLFTTRLVRFTYNKITEQFENGTLICDSIPGSNDHNSQRMIIAPETIGGPNFLFYACGDMGAGQGNGTTNPTRPIKSQLPNSYEGKILRFNLDEDGDAVQAPTTINYNRWIPNDNPYNTILGVQSAVWSIGIRNNQGFAYDPVSGLLYGSSHGAYSDDEINVLRRFKNYGHPLIVGHVDGNYDGTSTPSTSTSYSAGAPMGYSSGNSTCVPIVSEVGRRTEINAMGYGNYEDPLFSAYAGDNSSTPNSVKYVWSQSSTPNNSLWPSEGWSGLDLYTNKLIPGWKQSLVAAGLKWGRLIRLKLGPTGTTTLPSNAIEGGNTGDTILYLQSGNRYRDIAFGPNGKDIYVIMDRNASSAATDGNPPVTPACPDCLIKYTFLGYAPDAAGLSTIPKSIDVTTSTANVCNPGTTITIDATNNNLWVPITGPDGNIMAEINANGNNLGIVTSSFYQHSGPIRIKSGVRYLNRSITINPQNPPTLPSGSPLVKIRLYISKAEFDLLDADALSGLTGTGNIGLLKILKNNDACGSAAVNTTAVVNPTNTLADLVHGANGYVLQGDISGFSTFYFGTSNMTLPLDLLTFTGTLQDDKTTLLKWRTENEINTSHFVVERSTDGSNFSGIGTVSAAGNSSIALDYSLTDVDAANQQSLIIYYRLKMVDLNGEFKYSNIISVTLADITGAINIAPNPVTSEARITITAPEDGKLHYKIIDNAGRTILQRTLSVRKGIQNTVQVDMKNLASGMYFLNVTGAGLNMSLKVQKQ